MLTPPMPINPNNSIQPQSAQRTRRKNQTARKRQKNYMNRQDAKAPSNQQLIGNISNSTRYFRFFPKPWRFNFVPDFPGVMESWQFDWV
jgi:hypothetical protein